ncbi:MAG: FAD-dependent oxidoreductase [Elusimicrobia bacterium]|nr:FAD-dependent oxidoreductase [Elusimicrobiota bacterium]
MIRTDVLILGGGLSGLSTAYHLGERAGRSCLVVDKSPVIGGTAGSVRREGFVFDHTGHLLHLHDPYGKRLVATLLRGNLAWLARSSWIHSQGVDTRYPFQANTFGLPAAVVEECVAGFLKTVHWPAPPATGSFRDWCLAQFGEGISRRFMFPYNEKVWRRSLREITTDWQGPFVPKPAAGEVIRGALMDQAQAFGYNAAFSYPIRGGIQSLPESLARSLAGGRLRLGARVASVDLAARVAVVEGVGEVGFGRLVNTMPLPHFLDLARPLPAGVLEARRNLRHNSVYCLNIGIARPRVSDKHWIYFPEKGFAFYRAGFLSNFSRHVAPAGASSMYIEAARRPSEKVELPRLERLFLEGLRACGILRRSDRIVARHWAPIEYGYVVYDRDRTAALKTVFAFLRKAKVESIGRYGAWKYSFMEEALLDGKRCAERLSSGGRSRAQGLARGA